jgi:hypothetical protein
MILRRGVASVRSSLISSTRLPRNLVFEIVDLAREYHEGIITSSDVQDVLEGLELTSGYSYDELYDLLNDYMDYKN